MPQTLQPMVDWRPGYPLPHTDFLCDQGTSPEDLSVDDVRLIWWGVASSFDNEQLQEKLQPVVDAHNDWGCFTFEPIAQLSRQSPYPWPVLQMLREFLPSGAMVAVDGDEFREAETFNMLLIQIDIWHELTWKAFELCPVSALPPELLEMRLERDLGL